jgi:hypothetical protein
MDDQLEKRKQEIMQAYEASNDKAAFEAAIHEIGDLSRKMTEIVKTARKRMIDKGLLEATDEDAGINMETQLKEKIGDTVNGESITSIQQDEYNNWVDIHNSAIRLNELLDKLKVTPK